MPDNSIEILVNGWWETEDKCGELRVGDLFRTTKVRSHVSRVISIKPDGEGGTIIEDDPAGRPKNDG